MIRRFALIIVMIAVVLSSLACGSDDETTGPRITLAPPEKGSAVTFPDPNLEDLIREAFDRPSGDIYESDLKLLQELRANEKGITDLTGLKHCANLKILDLAGNDVEDLTPISNLTSLTDLGLYQNEISDITPLANLTGLNLIVLGENQVSDITPLANLTSLIYLYLADNQISDASPVSNLT
ncbi:MAG: hypothetical protein SVM79_10645, partial [Chloroflexota bacterium]|nr:hypothetical protein [Chloroflexota bacterium]